jgi:hypothetical protein
MSQHRQRLRLRRPVQERFPLSTKDMVRQIYLLSGAVIVILSLAIWLLISLS